LAPEAAIDSGETGDKMRNNGLRSANCWSVVSRLVVFLHCVAGKTWFDHSVFSRSYLINARAVFVRPSVRLSVTEVLWLNRRAQDRLRHRLLLITKSHIGFQKSYKSMTLDDLESYWQPYGRLF